MTRARGSKRPLRRTAISATAFLAATLFGACSADRTLLPPRTSSGAWVAGRVTGGPGENRPSILVYDAELAYSRYDPLADVRADAGGHYALPLRAGRYLLAVDLFQSNGMPVFYRAAGIVFDAAQADTIVVPERTSDTLRVNFPFTVLDLAVGVPRVLEGSEFELVLHQRQANGGFGNLSWTQSKLATVAQGRLLTRFGHIPPGTYRLQLRGKAGLETFWTPGTQDTLRADTVRVEPGETQRSFASDGPPTVSWLEGYAPHEGSDGWHAAKVEAFDPSGKVVANTAVGLGGGFRLGFLATARVRLRADGVLWLGGASLLDAEEFTLLPSDTVRAGLWDAGRLFIRLEREGNQDITGLRLRFYGADGSLRAKYAARTVGDYVLISPLEPGTWRLHLSPQQPGVDDVLPRWYDLSPSFEGATPVEVPEGGATGSLTVHLERGGRIRGRVAGPQGQSAWVNIIVTPADADTAWAMPYQFGDGPAFEFRGVPEGSYKIGATQDHVSSYPTAIPVTWYGGTASWDSATVVQVRDHEVIEGIEIGVRR
jgi:hypothetical protein